MATLQKDKSISLAICSILTGFTTALTLNYLTSTRKKATEKEKSTDEVIHHIITTRRTISTTYEPNLPQGWEDVLRKSISAAISAPNHNRTEPWRFYLPNRNTIVKICELNASIISQTNPKKGEAKLKRWLTIPGWIIVTCKKDNKISSISSSVSGSDDFDMNNPNGIHREDYAAVCCAIQNLCLSLHANGYGTKWGTGNVNFDSRFDELVGIPDDEYVVGTIWFGKHAKKVTTRETKLSVDDVLKIEV